MPVAPPIKLEVCSRPSPLRGEMWIRYGAAYASTLTAVGAAATLPRLPQGFVWLLLGITLLGLPISLGLRLSGLRFGGWSIPRFLLALAVSVVNVLLILVLVVEPLQKRIGTSVFSANFFHEFFIHHDADAAIILVLQVIALIMVCRCLVVVTDKDAVLCTVPAFCILVLLIVIERQPGVVLFFVLWAALAAVLFALDQRQEVARHASAFVPTLLPGQNTALSARTLGGVMAFSLLCAAILSFTMTSRIENRSAAEGWVSSLAMQLTQFAAALPEVSANAGPERQIDFTSGPPLPTKSPLWAISARDVRTGKSLAPNYWRLFTLAKYSGTAWQQPEAKAVRAPLRTLNNTSLSGPLPLRGDRARSASDMRRSVLSFDIAQAQRKLTPHSSFGIPTRLVRVRVSAKQANIGFVPHLPSIHYLGMKPILGNQDNTPDFLNVYEDQSVDVHYVETEQVIAMVSDVPSGDDYGIPGDGPPLKANQRPYPQAQLSTLEKKTYLQLPTMPIERVRKLAQTMLKGLPADASDYAKAAQLADALRKRATYTLRPPPLPTGRDATEFFLFDSPKGYCTHFAGALAILCRSIGIPARIAAGFTAGDLQQGGLFLVRESNAHAWTEVWVPNWGWATLDAVPADDRGDNSGDWWMSWADALGSVLTGVQAWLTKHGLLIGTSLLLCGVMGLVFYHERSTLPSRRLASLRFARRNISDKAARHTIDEVYDRAAQALQKRFRARTAWETPHEWLYAAILHLRLKNTAPLKRLTDLFVQTQYSSHELGAEESQEAWRALNELNWDTEK